MTEEVNTKTKTETKKENKVRKVKRKKEERLGFNWFFWISFIIILIPCGYFLYLLYQAGIQTSTPIVGDRIKNSVIYTINDEDVSYIESEVKALANIENCEVNLNVETLRITIDANDELTDDEYKQMCIDVYNIIDGRIPVATYFTRDGDYKQYDLEITVYDNISNEDVRMVTLYKNGNMESYTVQVLSDAKNPDVAYNLTHPETDEEESDNSGAATE